MSQNNHPYQGIWFSVLVPADSESDQVQANSVLRHIRSVENLKAVVHQAQYIDNVKTIHLMIRAETSSHNLLGTINAVRSRAANHCINLSTLDDCLPIQPLCKPIKFIEEPDIEWL